MYLLARLISCSLPFLELMRRSLLKNVSLIELLMKNVCLIARIGFGKSLVFQSLYWMLQAKLQQKARDQAHPKLKITFVFIPLSGIGEEQVETLKDLEDDPNAAFFLDNGKAEPRHTICTYLTMYKSTVNTRKL
ncbi:hypothetical protein V8E54_000742 [Elaphomyces granulatus]